MYREGEAPAEPEDMYREGEAPAEPEDQETHTNT